MVARAECGERTTTGEQFGLAPSFDVVVEPRDLAGPIDVGFYFKIP